MHIDLTPVIVSKDEAPAYAVDNEFIKHGYRVNYRSFKRLALSLFEIHNESANVWTHLIGMIIFAFIFISKTHLEKLSIRESGYLVH